MSRLTEETNRRQSSAARRRMWVLAASFAVVVAGCGGVSVDVPDGYQLVEHDNVSFAVPDDWYDHSWEDEDLPDLVHYQHPDAPEGVYVGAQASRITGSDIPDLVASSLHRGRLVYFDSVTQVRREEISIPGSQEGLLEQTEVVSPPLDGALVWFTDVIAVLGGGGVVVVTISGTPEDIPPAVIDVIVESVTVTNHGTSDS